MNQEDTDRATIKIKRKDYGLRKIRFAGVVSMEFTMDVGQTSITHICSLAEYERDFGKELRKFHKLIAHEFMLQRKKRERSNPYKDY